MNLTHKTSLRSKIIKYLEEKRDWVHSGDLEKFVIECDNKAETGGRVARKLAEFEVIEYKYTEDGAHCVMYRAKPIVTTRMVSIRERQMCPKHIISAEHYIPVHKWEECGAPNPNQTKLL